MRSMRRTLQEQLSRKERQIMDAVYALGQGAAVDVVRRLGDRSAYDSVRVTLGILEKKGFLAHRPEGNRHVYHPTIPRREAMRGAMRHLVSTFFEGSSSSAILAFLDHAKDRLSDDELEEIARWIEARSEKRL